jgi:nitrite reductase/ring-hydroxylating ferredoxin subunit
VSERDDEAVAVVGELPDGGVKAIRVGGRDLVLCRVGDDYFATQRQCLHQGGDLAEGIVNSGMIVCALHGWRFDVRTGQHEISPDTCLRTYPVRIDGERVLVGAKPNPLRTR